jgi:methylmalonyl-CoA mutase
MSSAGSPPPFPRTSFAEWRDGVEAELGPDAVTSRLRATTEDGIPVEPLYAPAGPGDGHAWNLAGRVVGLLPDVEAGFGIRQRFPLNSPPEVLEAAIAGGVQSLEFRVGNGESEGRPLAASLKGLDAGTVELSLEGMTAAQYASDGAAMAGFRMSWGIDPIGRAWHQGGAAGSLRSELLALPHAAKSGTPHSLLRASGEAIFDAGATTGMTLGATLAAAVAYLRALDDAGADPAWAASVIEVRLPCGPRFFETIAMLRAARLVWARVLEVASIVPLPLRVVASSGRRALTRHDPWNNALRSTAVGFAAAVGGADLLQLLPHDVRTVDPGAAAMRLARTTGLVLREEAALMKVLDPAAGSWFLESLTASLAEEAWDELRRLDAAGGIMSAIASGELSRRVAEAAAARHDRVRSRRHPIIGVTEHPVEGEAVPCSAEEAALAAMDGPFPFRPDARPYEALQAEQPR